MEQITYTPLDIEIDFVVLIDCLSDDERTTHQITSQLEHDLKSERIDYVTYLCNDRAQVIKCLTELLVKANEGKQFCINIVSHGNKDCIGFKPTGEKLDWTDLSSLLEGINTALKGRLLLNMMSCSGLNGIKINDFKKDQFPCYGLIGSADKLKMSDAKSINKKFYTKLFEGGKVNAIIPEIQAEVENETGRKNVIYCITSQGYQFIKNNKSK